MPNTTGSLTGTMPPALREAASRCGPRRASGGLLAALPFAIEVLASARGEFTEHGFRDAKIDRITERAELTHGAVCFMVLADLAEPRRSTALLESHFFYEEKKIVAALNSLEVPGWKASEPDFLLRAARAADQR